MIAILCLFLGFFVGWIKGWESAHATIAKECKRLGGFYAGKQTFKCTEITDEL